MSIRLRLIIIALIGLLGLAIWYSIDRAGNGTLDLKVVPHDATIILDGSKHISRGNVSLKPGDYTLEVSRDGFETQQTSFTITTKQTTSLGIALKATTATGLEYYAQHPDEQREAEGITGQNDSNLNQKSEEKAPIITQLPYFRRDWRIDYGKSVKNPNDPSAVALYITALNPTAQQEARDWITSQGYNPADYEIIYRTSVSAQ